MSMQVLDALGPNSSITMLKQSPHNFNYHIQHLPERLHEHAVHAQFPEILAKEAISVDCNRYSILAVTAALHALCSLDHINCLELRDGCTSLECNTQSHERFRTLRHTSSTF